MTLSRRAFLAGAAGTAGVAALGACTSSGGSGDGAPDAEPAKSGGPMGTFHKEKLVLSRWSGGVAAAAQERAARQWAAQTGADVDIRAVPLATLRDRQESALRGTGGLDILYVHPSWFGQFAEAGYLAPLDDLLSDAGRNPPGFSAHSYVPRVYAGSEYRGKHYGVPDFVSTVVLAYRKDVFLALGIEPPTTTAEVIAAAQRVNGTNGSAGIVLPGNANGEVADVMSTLLTAQGNWWFDAKERPSLDASAAAAAVQFYVDAAKFAPREMLDDSSADAASYAAQGNATMIIGTTPSLQVLQDPSASTTIGRWGYAPIAVTQGKPAGELMYWLWCIAANSKQRNAAYSYLQWYTDTRQQGAIAGQTGTFGATTDFYKDAGQAAALPFAPALAKALANTNPQPSVPNWLTAQDGIEGAVRDAITGKATVTTAVSRIQQALHSALDS